MEITDDLACMNRPAEKNKTSCDVPIVMWFTMLVKCLISVPQLKSFFIVVKGLFIYLFILFIKYLLRHKALQQGGYSTYHRTQKKKKHIHKARKKSSLELIQTISGGRVFHSLIVRTKKE